MTATLQWFGTATWRLTVHGYVIWIDAYLKRAPTAAPVPERAEEVTRADAVLIGHSHFDHIADAGLVAKNTGATVVGSAHTVDIVTEEGVEPAKTITVAGGETMDLGPVALKTFRSLHGFNALRPDSGNREWPDPEGRTGAERAAILRERDPQLLAAAQAHMRNVPPKQQQDGGPIAYLLEWGDTRLFWHDTPGMVTESWEAASRLQPTVAILSAAAAFSTPNVDGTRFDAGQQPFVGHMAGILRAPEVILNHHDDWCPPITFHMPEETFLPHLPEGVRLEKHQLGEVFEV
jgi:L-ascorbate metabolism protein UlaG (beta-lactamase superfamily)